MSSTSNTSGGGIGLAGILTIIFVFLRAFNVIDWSWWWVFSPLWISAAIGIGILIIIGLIYLIVEIIDIIL